MSILIVTYWISQSSYDLFLQELSFFPCPVPQESTLSPLCVVSHILLCRNQPFSQSPVIWVQPSWPLESGMLRRPRELAVMSFRGHLLGNPWPKVIVFIYGCWFRLQWERNYSEEPVNVSASQELYWNGPSVIEFSFVWLGPIFPSAHGTCQLFKCWA